MYADNVLISKAELWHLKSLSRLLYTLHLAKASKSSPCYKYGKTVIFTTKDCFINSLPELSQLLSISDNLKCCNRKYGFSLF